MSTEPVQAILVTRAEAARMLSLSEGTLKNLTQPDGPLPVVRIGRAVRYAVDDLRAFVRSRTSDVAQTQLGS